MYQFSPIPKTAPKTPVARTTPNAERPKPLDRAPQEAKPNSRPLTNNSQTIKKTSSHKSEIHETHSSHLPSSTEVDNGENVKPKDFDFSDVLAETTEAASVANTPEIEGSNSDINKKDADSAAAKLAANQSDVENQELIAMVSSTNKLVELDIHNRVANSTQGSKDNSSLQNGSEPQISQPQTTPINTITNTETSLAETGNPTKTSPEKDIPVVKLSDIANEKDLTLLNNIFKADKNLFTGEVEIDAKVTETDSRDSLKQVVGRILEGLAKLTGETGEKSGITPDLAAKLTTQFHKIVENYRLSGASDEVKEGFVKFSQTLAEAVKNIDARTNPAKVDVTQVTQKALEVQTTKTAEKLQNLMLKTDEQSNKPQQPQTPTQPNEIQQNAGLSKYAGRYNKTNYNADGAATASTESIAETGIKSRSSAIYSATGGTNDLKNSASITALEKMSQNSPMDFLNQMQANIGNQQFDAHNQDNVVNVKLAIQNGRLAQNLPVNGLAFQIGKQLNKGNSEFQIRLDPAELGRINVKLTVKQGGDVRAHIVAERNDVFELLQRDARALERALADAGLEDKNVELEFSLAQSGADGQNFSGNMADEDINDDSNNMLNSELDEDMVEMVANHIPLHVTSNGIDRKI